MHQPLTEDQAQGLIQCAATLSSEQGENAEYDRALVELVGDFLGYVEENRVIVERRIVRAREHSPRCNAFASAAENMRDDGQDPTIRELQRIAKDYVKSGLSECTCR